MPTVAVVLVVVYVAVSFGVPTWLQLRRTGDSGFRGISGAPGSAAWWGGVLFVLAVLAAVVGPVLAVSQAVAPVPVLDHAAVAVVGLALAVVSGLATWAAQHAMGASWRIGVDAQERTTLVQAGAFAWVRNPVFTAMISATLGLVLMVPNAVALAALVLLVAAVELQTRVVEEPYLLRVHGDAYRAYAARVGRLVPGVGRLRD